MTEKKHPVANVQHQDKKSAFRLGRTPAANQLELASKRDVTTKKVRLSADIDHQSYVKIKLYSAQQRKSIVSLVTEWIDTHCTG